MRNVLQTRKLIAAMDWCLNAFFGVTVGRATEVKQLTDDFMQFSASTYPVDRAANGHSQHEYQYDGRGCLHLDRDRLQCCAINTLSSCGSNSASSQRSDHANSDPRHTKLPVHRTRRVPS
jgi:hypothetical protein